MTIRLAHAFVPRLEEFSQWGRLTVKKDKSCRQKKCADWAMLSPVHYLPLVTTALSIGFAVYLFRSWTARRSGPHLLWWAWGAVCYGLGTLLEGTITLAGNSVWLTKGWYVAGALLGGYPLAQGAVFLHAHRKTAAALGWIMTTLVAVLAVLVFLSPANLAALEATRPSSDTLDVPASKQREIFIRAIADLGYAIVPREPTKAMIEMWWQSKQNITHADEALAAWQSIIAASEERDG